ncbi:hypothetical protein BH09ACT8_BH09ACT8_21270 [soil metagenome]
MTGFKFLYAGFHGQQKPQLSEYAVSILNGCNL